MADSMALISRIDHPDLVALACPCRGVHVCRPQFKTGSGRHRMVLHNDRQILAPHCPFFFLQVGKGMRRMQLMYDVAINVNQRAAVGPLPDTMRFPDFVKQCLFSSSK